MTTLAFYLPTVMLISLVGGFLPLLARSVAAGAGIAIKFQRRRAFGRGFFSLLPETGKVLNESIGWPILGGFLLIFVMERFVFVHACEERECDIHHMGIPAFLGISLHSLLDGVALGAGLLLPQLGPVVLLAVIIHKMPDSISISSILLAAGWERRRVATLNLLFSLTTPVGALLAFWLFRSLSPENVAVAIGISAGTFLAIATADILPQVHRIEQRNPVTLLFLLIGLTVSWLGRMVAHTH